MTLYKQIQELLQVCLHNPISFLASPRQYKSPHHALSWHKCRTPCLAPSWWSISYLVGLPSLLEASTTYMCISHHLVSCVTWSGLKSPQSDSFHQTSLSHRVHVQVISSYQVICLYRSPRLPSQLEHVKVFHPFTTPFASKCAQGTQLTHAQGTCA